MLSSFSLEHLLTHELDNDRYFDDVTTRLLGDRAQAAARAVVVAKQPGVFAGSNVLAAMGELFRNRKVPVQFEAEVADGALLSPGQTVARITGPLGICLSVERTVLNLLTHLCGVATRTSEYVDAVKPHPTRILATRKTLPGLRDLQLQAVEAGGGLVHRRSLSDGILIKENHLAGLAEADLLREALRRRSPLHRVEIEVQSLESLSRVLNATLEAPPDVIMLDNLPLETMAQALKLIHGRAKVEVSGGVRLEQCVAIAALGVDYISVGALTHSVRALDLSLDIL